MQDFRPSAPPRAPVWQAALLIGLIMVGGQGRALAEPASRTLSESVALGETGDADQVPGGCAFSARLVNAATNQPAVGVSVTVLETGETTRTDADGRYRVTLPGAGTWHIRGTLAGYEPLTRELVVGAGCAVVSSNIVDEETAPAAPATPAAGAQRFSGSITIESDPAPVGTEVVARVNGEECGRARVSRRGEYTVDVALATTRARCGTAGASVRLSIAPAFGSGWQLDRAFPFQAGGTVRVDLAFDPTTLPADGGNVPLLPRYWPDLGAVPIAACGRISRTTSDAAAGALAMWRTAHDDHGLLAGLDVTEDACRNGVDSIVIGEVNWPDRREVVGANGALNADGEPCGDDACDVYTSFVVINLAARQRTAAEWAAVMAHEIGHALGLDHAYDCNGGTIMFDDVICRYPSKSIGVDDIAALNRRYAESPPAAARISHSRMAPAALTDRAHAVSTLTPDDLARMDVLLDHE